ncbi:MAG: DinB family protein [Chloroflexi bacterium]|nr:DinB family protein [Chloroflexota bacterium]
MQPIFEAYLDRLEFLHKEVEQALDNLPPAALDWTPGPDMSSLTVLVIHLAGSEQFRIGDLISRGESDRDRAAEFRSQGLDVAMLKQRLAAVLADSRHTLEKLTMEDLAATRVSPDTGQTHTAAWLLMQTMMHIALHVGHVQMMRQLWDQRSTVSLERAAQ